MNEKKLQTIVQIFPKKTSSYLKLLLRTEYKRMSVYSISNLKATKKFRSTPKNENDCPLAPKNVIKIC